MQRRRETPSICIRGHHVLVSWQGIVLFLARQERSWRRFRGYNKETNEKRTRRERPFGGAHPRQSRWTSGFHLPRQKRHANDQRRRLFLLSVSSLPERDAGGDTECVGARASSRFPAAYLGRRSTALRRPRELLRPSATIVTSVPSLGGVGQAKPSRLAAYAYHTRPEKKN